MTLSLDHIFILTATGAPTADQLVALGFVEGNANVHPGQGTSNRRFFFSDFTIELLYISDEEEAVNGAGKGLGLLTRYRDLQASPFGLVVRVANEDTTPDFPGWQYWPDYFNGKMCFHVGENSTLLLEPLCICMPPALPKRSSIPAALQNPQWQFSTLEIKVPVDKPSAVLRQFEMINKVNIEYGKPHNMTLNFNKGASQKSIDLSPVLPLTIKY